MTNSQIRQLILIGMAAGVAAGWHSCRTCLRCDDSDVVDDCAQSGEDVHWDTLLVVDECERC